MVKSILDNNKAELRVVTWGEMITKYQMSLDSNHIVPFRENVLAREPLYHLSFSLVSKLLHPETQYIVNNALINSETLHQKSKKGINGTYVAWHCRYSEKWDCDRNLSEMNL